MRQAVCEVTGPVPTCHWCVATLGLHRVEGASGDVIDHRGDGRRRVAFGLGHGWGLWGPARVERDIEHSTIAVPPRGAETLLAV